MMTVVDMANVPGEAVVNEVQPMTAAEALAWFAELGERWSRILATEPHPALGADLARLIADSDAALAAVFPLGHSSRNAWEDVRRRARQIYPTKAPPEIVMRTELGSVFLSAAGLLKAGRLRSLLDGVRVETVSECLDTAEVLLGAAHLAAAMVIAGGALELHLKHLCVRYGLAWQGPGSIDKYNGALAAARNQGATTVSTGDTKLVTAWGDRRNDAAHDPVKFSQTAALDELRLVVEGIRQFLARNP